MKPVCDLKATEEQKDALRVLARSNQREEADRVRAILWTLDGRTCLEIASLLGVRDRQVKVWRKLFREGGVDALRSRKAPGRPVRKGEAALAIARELLASQKPDSPPWTLPRLVEEIRRREGFTISTGWLSVLLRKRGRLPGVGPGTRSRVSRTPKRSSASG